MGALYVREAHDRSGRASDEEKTDRCGKEMEGGAAAFNLGECASKPCKACIARVVLCENVIQIYL